MTNSKPARPTRQRTESGTDSRRGSQQDRVNKYEFRPTQFGVRENTSVLKTHASRLVVDTVVRCSPRGLHIDNQLRLASRVSEPDNPIITMPQEAATGGKEEVVPKTFLGSCNAYCHEARRAPVTPEPLSRPTRRHSFSASNVAICWSSPAEASPEPMHSARGASKSGGVRLSELGASVIQNEAPIPKPTKPCTIGSGSPR